MRQRRRRLEETTIVTVSGFAWKMGRGAAEMKDYRRFRGGVKDQEEQLRITLSPPPPFISRCPGASFTTSSFPSIFFLPSLFPLPLPPFSLLLDLFLLFLLCLLPPDLPRPPLLSPLSCHLPSLFSSFQFLFIFFFLCRFLPSLWCYQFPAPVLPLFLPLLLLLLYSKKLFFSSEIESFNFSLGISES